MDYGNIYLVRNVLDELQNAVNFLYKEAAKRWIMEQDIVDDITIILIALE